MLENIENKASLRLITSYSGIMLPITPCEVCKTQLVKYHIAKHVFNKNPIYLYHKKETYSSAWLICGEDICFNMALLSDDSFWNGV